MKKREMTCFLLIISLTAVFIAVIWIILQNNNEPQPKKTVENFIGAFEQRDADGMLENIAPYEAELIRSVTARLEKSERVQSAVKIVKYLLNSPQISSFIEKNMAVSLDYKIISEKTDGDFAEVAVQISDEAEAGLWKFHLVRIEDKWYIEYITAAGKQKKTDL